MNSKGLIGFIVVIAFGVCMVGSFVAAGALGSVPKTKLPRYRRLRSSFMGAGFGGLAIFVMVPMAVPIGSGGMFAFMAAGAHRGIREIRGMGSK